MCYLVAMGSKKLMILEFDCAG